MRVFGIEAVTQALCGKFARGIAGQAQRLGDRRSQQRIPKRIKNKREGAFGDMMSFVADRELRDERANGIEDGIERVPVSAEDHPGRKRSCTFLAERVEALVDDDPRISLAGAGPFNRIGDAAVDRIGDRPGEFALKAGSGAKMVKEIGVGSPDLGGDCFEGDRLRTLFEQNPPRRGKRG